MPLGLGLDLNLDRDGLTYEIKNAAVKVFLWNFRFFKQELEREADQFRRNLLLQEIRTVETKILDLLREQRAQIERENRFMQAALDKLDKEGKKCKYNLQVDLFRFKICVGLKDVFQSILILDVNGKLGYWVHNSKLKVFQSFNFSPSK